MSYTEIVSRKVDLYKKLYSLVFANFYSDDFGYLRKSIYFSLFFTPSVAICVNLRNSMHPLKSVVIKSAILFSLIFIYNGYSKDIDILLSSHNHNRRLTKQVTAIKNELVLYNTFNKIVDNGSSVNETGK